MTDLLPHRPLLADWSTALSCYTAALGCWCRYESEAWWPSLLEGAPGLELTRVGNLFRFDHYPVAPASRLGLVERGDEGFERAWSGISAELEARGRVVVAGDTFFLPWQREYGKHHSMHWFLLHRDERLLADDPLEFVSTAGLQLPARSAITDSLDVILQAFPEADAATRLRESAALGVPAQALGARYRWLVFEGPRRPQLRKPDTAGAVRALARHFEEHGREATAYAQTHDIWQAGRQREFVAAANRANGVTNSPWELIAEEWRQLSPLLLHAELSAAAGVVGSSLDSTVALLYRIADLENRLGYEPSVD